MTRAGVARALATGPRWAGRLALALGLFTAVGEASSLAGVVAVVSSTEALAAFGAIALGLAAGALGELLDTGDLARRIARGLLLAGGACIVFGIPASLVLRDTTVFTAVEGEEAVSAPPDLSGLRLGRVEIAPESSLPLLSKRVEVDAVLPGGAQAWLRLWPPAQVGPWRVTILRYGFAPEIQWEGPRGEERASGFLMLGTFPHTEEEGRMFQWTPEANLMMGVGFYPPKLEDLLTLRDRKNRLFVRMDEATLAGARRDLRVSEAWRWLADGRPEDPVYRVQVASGATRVFDGRIPAGGGERFDGGSVRIGPDLVLWVELEAVRDPWLPIAAAGAALLGMGALGWAWRRMRPPREGFAAG